MKSQVQIKRVHSQDWERCGKDVLEIEEIFDPNLRETPKSIKAFFDNPKAIVLVAESEANIVGCLYSASIESNLLLETPNPAECTTFENVLKEDENYGRNNTLYVTSFGVLPKYEERGIGTRLYKELIEIARESGYKFVTSHNEPGTSCHIAEKLGERKIKLYKNWYETGEDYWYMKLEL